MQLLTDLQETNVVLTPKQFATYRRLIEEKITSTITGGNIRPSLPAVYADNNPQAKLKEDNFFIDFKEEDPYYVRLSMPSMNALLEYAWRKGPDGSTQVTKR